MSYDAVFGPLWLTMQLALVTTICLLAIVTPLAWWLANTKSPLKPIVETLTALPLVLPATVLGFYCLILFSPTSPLGALWVSVTGTTLTFSFSGLVLASIIYSFPFALQPLQGAFEAVGRKPMEAAATLRASPFNAFLTVAVPQSRRGFIVAAVLSFAHTVGEFGVVLMVGGAIPGETKTISLAIYNHVETLDYANAHILSSILLAFSFLVLLITYSRAGATSLLRRKP